ncbi:pro-resilin-like [Palaemon carinicauda]|uniref:pro-resilin-like n=1 Tax=Palaemon carinicauda TaxID=392227 RepID=UPI0035B65134
MPEIPFVLLVRPRAKERQCQGQMMGVVTAKNVFGREDLSPAATRGSSFLAKICLLLSLVGAVFGGPSQPQYGYASPPSHEEPAKYDFNYAVKDDYSGNDFGHQEARDGYDTQGSYYVLLPDGRLQKVSYNVNGDSGFVAEVTYEGEPQYNPAPSYA